MTVVTPRVLVVSESRITRRVVEMTFADQPMELVMAANGQAGLDAWNAQPAAVVLADVAMAAPDGLASARHVQPPRAAVRRPCCSWPATTTRWMPTRPLTPTRAA